MTCPVCREFGAEFAYLLRHHANNLHSEFREFYKCQLPGCEHQPGSLQTGVEIVDHYCGHFRARTTIASYVTDRVDLERLGLEDDDDEGPPEEPYDPFLLNFFANS